MANYKLLIEKVMKIKAPISIRYLIITAVLANAIVSCKPKYTELQLMDAPLYTVNDRPPNVRPPQPKTIEAKMALVEKEHSMAMKDPSDQRHSMMISINQYLGDCLLSKELNVKNGNDTIIIRYYISIIGKVELERLNNRVGKVDELSIVRTCLEAIPTFDRTGDKRDPFNPEFPIQWAIQNYFIVENNMITRVNLNYTGKE